MRVDHANAFSTGLEAMLAFERPVRPRGLERLLLELVKPRASQTNGCAYCLGTHPKDTRARGEDEQRPHILAPWREVPLRPPASGWRSPGARRSFCCHRPPLPATSTPTTRRSSPPEETAALTLQIAAINDWNRLAVGLRTPVGDYRSPFPAAARATEMSRED